VGRKSFKKVTNRKNYNSILFLTTLGVYFGLVLVGVTPQILAQTSKKDNEPYKINLLVPSQGYVFTFDLNPILELHRLTSIGSPQIKIEGRLIPLQQKFSNWEIINVKGSKEVIEFIDKNFFVPAEVDSPLPRIFEELFQSVEVSKDDITITHVTTFSDQKKAEQIANIHSRMAEYARAHNADKKVAGNYYLINTSARAENNQVFIVTRLPRAGLDSLLAKDAK